MASKTLQLTQAESEKELNPTEDSAVIIKCEVNHSTVCWEEGLPGYQIFAQYHRCYKFFGVLHSIHTRTRATEERVKL